MGKRRNLQAHNKLLLDVIKRQAGTLEKAILEAVMNAIEAGSKLVAIELQADGIEANKPGAKLIIEDQGKGFRSEKEIIEWFETFGTPHSESENKTWAQFRMGRGQMFAFGRNVWRTGQFEMTVDVDNMGLEYELETGLPAFKGCRIEIDLYHNPIGNYNYRSVDVLKSAIKRQIEFMEGVITFNGEQLNTPASKLSWDNEDDDAYYMFGKGQDLAFYNLGAFVMTQSASRAGVTGVVVSKKMLKVNFARNDIQSDCPVYAGIQDVVKDNRIKKVRKQKRTLNRNERVALLMDLRDGIVEYKDVRGLNLIELSNDRMMSLDKVRQIRTPWSAAPHGDRIADRLLYLEQAVVINEELFDELDYSGEPREFFDWLLREAYAADNRYRGNLRTQWATMKKLYQPFKTGLTTGGLADGFTNKQQRIPQDKWTAAEKRIVKALSKHDCWDGRVICIGTSDTALAWTDGSTFICLAREYLRKTNPSSIWGASHVVMTMFHEVAHNDSTEESHHHGMEFYRNFHNIVAGEGMGWSPAYIMANLPAELRSLRAEDWHEKEQRKEKRAMAARNRKLGVVEGENGETKVAKTPKAPKAPAKKKRKVRKF
jgi:hypothetical protein